MPARPNALSVLVLAIVAGCGGAAPAPAVEPDPVAAAPTVRATAEPATEAAPSLAPSAPRAAGANVPDDYELTPHDCEELGRQFGALIRSDEVAKLSPKLADKQRDQVVGSIEKAAEARREQWAASCGKSLVGSVQERKSLRCAMSAKSVSAFDACLNGDSVAAPEADPPAKSTPKKKR